ncbi:hypothetical protein DPMN_073936 [Dreissena polymorpha]|uniref:Uncharacterized protein n=1 Tax=Dreissena polymorpha TaxID=45954 RepID=A0A9D3YHF2_DREPO|nr:hypothetical protein DPMN_073936 [Dreissena polymorpha]
MRCGKTGVPEGNPPAGYVDHLPNSPAPGTGRQVADSFDSDILKFSVMLMMLALLRRKNSPSNLDQQLECARRVRGGSHPQKILFKTSPRNRKEECL